MRRTLLTMALLATAGCASAPLGEANSAAGVAPILSVERFLQAANTGDLAAMARIFGNADGAIADRSGNGFVCAFIRMGSWIGLGEPCMSRVEIELRMNAIAVLLLHDDYAVRTESVVPGRRRPTTRINVDIERGNERFVDVPFMVVQTSDGRWLVEEIGLEVMTAEAPSSFDELPEYPTGALGMNESHQVPPCAGPRLFVDELDSPGAQLCQLGTNVGDAIGEVV